MNLGRGVKLGLNDPPMFKRFGLLFLMHLLWSCSGQTNLFSVLGDKEDLSSPAAAIMKAQAHYDRGEIDDAQTLAQKVWEADPRNLEAAHVLALVALAKTIGDPLTIARELSADSEKKKSIRYLGLGRNELFEIGEEERSDPDYPLLVPKCLSFARQSQAKLQWIGKGVDVLCPFIPEAGKTPEDKRQSCESVEVDDQDLSNIVFSWMLLHLVEAVTFNEVINFPSGEGEGSHLSFRLLKLQQVEVTSLEGVEEFSKQLGRLLNVIDRILPLTEVCSGERDGTLFQGLFHNLSTIQKSLLLIPGTPKKVKERLSVNIDKIIKAGQDVNSMRTSLLKKSSGSATTKIQSVLKEYENVLKVEDKRILCQALPTLDSEKKPEGAVCDGL